MSFLRSLTVTFSVAFVSLAIGQVWMPLDVGASAQTITTMDDVIYVSSYGFGGGILRSEDDGQTWEPAITGMPSNLVRSVGRSGNYLMASHNTGGIYRSADGGDNWTPANSGIPGNVTYVKKFFHINGVTLAVYNGEISTGGGIYRSTNNGTSWSLGHSGMSSNMTIYHLAYNQNEIYAATSVGIYRSTDGALQWQSVGPVNYHTYALQQVGQTLVAITTFGVIRYDLNTSTWNTTPATGIPFTPGRGELISYDGYLYAIIGSGPGSSQVYRSSDNGVSFVEYNSGMATADQTNQNQFHATPDRLYMGSLTDAYWIEGSTTRVAEQNAATVAIYPTVFNDGFTIDLSGKDAGLEVIMIDAAGREVVRRSNLPASSVRMDRGTLASGSYQCLLNDPKTGTMVPLGHVIAE